jgi:integrase/recombinase XerD
LGKQEDRPAPTRRPLIKRQHKAKTITLNVIGDVATKNGDVRREIKLGVHQTKGSKGRTVILSGRVQKEIASFFKNTQPNLDQGSPLIASQRNGRAFSNVTLSMLFKEIYETAGIRTSSHSGRRTFATRLNEKRVGMRTIQKLMGHRHIGTHDTVTFQMRRFATPQNRSEIGRSRL